MSKDYYNILGISRGADQKEIKKAYRNLAKEFHPDKNGSSEAAKKFKEINEAFSVLSNPQKRQQYDQFGYDGSRADGGGFNSGFNPQSGGSGGGQYSGFGDFSSIFDTFFGRGFGGFSQKKYSERDSRGSDLSISLKIKFKEAVFGTEKEVSYLKKDRCEICNGSGSKDGKVNSCNICGGSGRVRKVSRTLFGDMAVESVCDNCRGEGRVIESPCFNCNGTGRVTKSVNQKIRVPAGAENGLRLRFEGMGDAGIRNGEEGDLYVTLEVGNDKIFEHRNGDIFITLPIEPALAVLGGEINVPTVNGAVKMKVPKGTQYGTEFRLRGKGGPRLRGGGSGDQFVKIIIEIPKRISGEEKKFWESLDRSAKGKKKMWGKLF